MFALYFGRNIVSGTWGYRVRDITLFRSQKTICQIVNYFSIYFTQNYWSYCIKGPCVLEDIRTQSDASFCMEMNTCTK